MAASAPRLMIVDDDHQTRLLVQEYFERNGFSVVASDGASSMWRELRRSPVDVILLDVMLPGQNGLEICRELRQSTDTPIIMLTAISEVTDRVVGLEIGADDYVAKPFEPRELLARVRAAIRRSATRVRDRGQSDGSEIYAFDGWTIDLRHRRLQNAEGALISLTSAEFDLLAVLVRNANRPLSRDQLLEFTQGRTAYAGDRSIDVLVSRIRSKLGSKPSLIRGLRGIGYIFECKVDRR
jgi:two-component system, OmpR family, response regulator